MVKFLSVLGSVLVVLSFATLMWPRFSPNPRPEPLQKLHDMLLTTTLGKNAANVLGVADDHTVIPLTPQSISQQVITSIRTRVSDVVITHAVREITKRFRDLPIQDQAKVLEEFTKAVTETEATASPTQQLSNPSE